METVPEHGGSVILDDLDDAAEKPLVRRSEVEATFQEEVKRVVTRITGELQEDIRRLWYPGRESLTVSPTLGFQSNVETRRMHGYIRQNYDAFRKAISRCLEGFEVSVIVLAPHVPAEVDGLCFTAHVLVKSSC